MGNETGRKHVFSLTLVSPLNTVLAARCKLFPKSTADLMQISNAVLWVQRYYVLYCSCILTNQPHRLLGTSLETTWGYLVLRALLCWDSEQVFCTVPCDAIQSWGWTLCGCLTSWPAHPWVRVVTDRCSGKGCEEKVTHSSSLSSYFRLPVKRRFTHTSWETFIAAG